MARVVSPIDTGTLGGTVVIGSDGKARAYRRPFDPRSSVQLAFRQQMRALNRVLRLFAPATDADVIAAVSSPSWWSSETFRRWAANHGTAIDEDLDRYGRAFAFGGGLLLDDFNRADADSPGPDWTKRSFSAYPPNAGLADFPIRSNRLRAPNNTLGIYLWSESQEQDVDVWATAYGRTDASGQMRFPAWARVLLRASGSLYPCYQVSVDSSLIVSLYRWLPGGPQWKGSDYSLMGASGGYRIGAAVTGAHVDVYAARLTGDWQRLIRYTDVEPLTGEFAGFSFSAGWVPADPPHYTELDDFGCASLRIDETRALWNSVAHAMGIEDLPAPIAPFRFGEAGEILFLVCCRLWRMAVDVALPDPVGTDPANWRAYIESGSYPA